VTNCNRALAISVFALLSGAVLSAQPRTQLKAETVVAFDGYVEIVEETLQARLDGDASKFLAISENSGWRTSLRDGLVNPEFIEKSLEVPGGLIQDWTATMFAPNASGEDVIALLTDYDHHSDIYDEVIAGQVISRTGSKIRSKLRLRKHKVITIVLDTEHEIEVIKAGEGRWQLHSHSTRINQVQNVGKSNEMLLPEGEDTGFLWRMNAYWSIQEVDGGVYVECRSTTLTRGIPFGLGWLIDRFTLAVPRESLVATLEATRNELAKRADRFSEPND